jgi:hypothetical protein
MNPLDKFNLKTKLPSKEKKGVEIIITKQVFDPINPNPKDEGLDKGLDKGLEAEVKDKELRIKMTDRADNGRQAKDIYERLKKKTNTTIISKFPEKAVEVIAADIENKAPVIEAEVATKPRKLKKPLIILEEEVELGLEGVEGEKGKERKTKEPLVDRTTPAFQDAFKRAEYANVEAIKTAGIEVITDLKGKLSSYKIMTPSIQMMHIGDTTIGKRLPVTPPYALRVSDFYMNNREKFVEFINDIFTPYKEDLQDETKNISCDEIGKDTGKIGLLTHQKIVREYMNLYTPYRGLLLYHGLGSGKTCSSIAIAEGLKSYRRIIVMTPASLKRNYIEEIKKCGDLIYRKNQFWEWMSVESNDELIEPLSAALGLPIDYIKTNRGAWLVNIKKPANYPDLSTSDKKSLNNQLDEMINYKYWFINYNGLRREMFNKYTHNLEKNIFDNAVVIIDEAHNLISRIVNKINKASKFAEAKKGPGTLMHSDLSLQIYEFLLRAEGCRIVLLTGTPIINYPNEIGILFNILRGYIKTWTFKLDTKGKSVSKELILDWFSKEKVLDYIDYNSKSQSLVITRNPYGFQNKITKTTGYKGVRYDNHDVDAQGNYARSEEGVISDEMFIKRTLAVLKDREIDVSPREINFTVNTALPDTMDSFVNNFIDKESGDVHNIEKFKRRIIGLTSYFRSAQEELLPRYDRVTDRHVVQIPMSDYQFQIYEQARSKERDNEKPSKKGTAKVDKDGMFIQPVSTYKIFSRLFCNFVMPNPPGRPTPAMSRLVKLFGSLAKHKASAAALQDISETEKFTLIDNNVKAYLEKLPAEFAANKEIVAEIDAKIDIYIKDFLDGKTTDTLEAYLINTGAQVKSRLPLPTLPAPTTKAVPVYSKGELKAREKLAKEAEKIMAEDAKIAKKIEKENIKAFALLEKEEAKALVKKEKEDARALAKKEKEDAKALAKKEKKGKGLYDYESDTDLDTDSDTSDTDLDTSDSDTSDSDTDSETPVYHSGGAGSPKGEGENENPFQQWVDKDESDDEFSVASIPGIMDEDANFREKDELEGDELLEKLGGDPYKNAITETVAYLKANKERFLNLDSLKMYSPKFLAMIETIQSREHPGLHLVYSQFRSMEGIGIFALALEANGFARFKIKRSGADSWEINMTDADLGKPTYALYTGTEDSEEREIIRNIYNGDWNNIPNNISTQLRAMSTNNNMGEIVKVLMITSAGSEGINLRNTRYVHIMEPYWHPVRIEQVIGRARRICSHQGLEEQYRTVEVFIYLMVFTKEQLDSDSAIEIKLKDYSKYPPHLPQTSDENLYEILSRKEGLSAQLLMGIKEASVDCATHSRSNAKEGIHCLRFDKSTISDYAYKPILNDDEIDAVAAINRKDVEWKGEPIKYKTMDKNGNPKVTMFMLRVDNNDIYDYQSVIDKEPRLVGKFVESDGKYIIDFY